MLRKVLIVDDSALVLHMQHIFLSRYAGARLIDARNGAEALDKLAAEPDVDLILLDINMPVMNGLELLRNLSETPRFAAIPVIVVSTDGRDDDVAMALKMGARGYLKKPLDGPALHRLIEATTGVKPD